MHCMAQPHASVTFRGYERCWNPNRLQEEDKTPGVFSRLFGLRSPRRPSTPVRETCQSKSAVVSRKHRDGAPAQSRLELDYLYVYIEAPLDALHFRCCCLLQVEPLPFPEVSMGDESPATAAATAVAEEQQGALSGAPPAAGNETATPDNEAPASPPISELRQVRLKMHIGQRNWLQLGADNANRLRERGISRGTRHWHNLGSLQGTCRAYGLLNSAFGETHHKRMHSLQMLTQLN